MSKTARIIMLTGLLAISAASLTSCGKPARTSTQTAEGIVDAMVKNDFASATADFSPTMQSQLPTDKLQEGWTIITGQIGAFKARTGTRQTTEQGFDAIYVTCQFEKANIDVKVTFDNNKQVAGIFMIPTQSSPGGKR